MAVLHRRLLAEASTAAWQDYLLLNAFVMLLCVLPALLASRRLWHWQRSSEPSATPTSDEAETETSVGARTTVSRSDRTLP